MSCFGGRDEQIYLVEFTIERLNLTEDKYHEEFADCPPLVKLKFIDFPVFVISRRTEDTAEITSSPSSEGTHRQQRQQQPYDEHEGLLYACGKSCLFVKKPRDLVASMQSQPLRIGIFRPCETFPIAEGSVPLSGCLCDQVAMASNDRDHRPKPYELVGSYNIADPGLNPAGSIKLFLRLTLLGTYIISHYQLYEDYCVFKNDYDGELRVTKVEGDNDEDDEHSFVLSEGTVLAAMRSDARPREY